MSKRYWNNRLWGPRRWDGYEMGISIRGEHFENRGWLRQFKRGLEKGVRDHVQVMPNQKSRMRNLVVTLESPFYFISLFRPSLCSRTPPLGVPLSLYRRQSPTLAT